MKPTVRRALPWLVTLGLALACDGKRKPEPTTPPADATRPAAQASADAKAGTAAKTVADASPETTAPEPPKPVPPRAVVFYRKAPKYRVKLFALPEASAPEPAAARDLQIVADDGGGSIAHGTGTPVLSGDGRWLAFLDDGRLVVAALDGSVTHRITKHRAHQVEVLISGFSPDSSRLMFHQGVVQFDDPPPLPKGVVEGFQELVLADLKLEPRVALEAFIAYTEDGRHVLFERRGTLVSFDLDTGATKPLQQAKGSYGFSQLVLHGERILYVQHPANDKNSQVVIDTLGAGKPIALSPEADFAGIQWPQISLDGRHMTYTNETDLRVRSIDHDDTRTLMTCTQRHCDHAWDSASTVLVLDSGQLSRVSLEGSVTPLATDVQGFVLAGVPG